MTMQYKNSCLIGLLFLVALSLFSCKDETVDSMGEIKTKHKLNLISDLALYETLRQADSAVNNSFGDAFDIDTFYVEDNWLNVVVGYAGGCEEHIFDIVWDGNTLINIDSAYSDTTATAIINIAIKHDANDDACEAYITDTLKVDLELLLKEFGETLPDNFVVNIVNGYSGDDGSCWTGDFTFEQSKTCVLKVIAKEVECGTGVWDNLWFKIERSDSPNHLDSLDILLQPIALEGEWLVPPIAGKTYNVGVFLSYFSDSTSDSTITCLVYPGPSVPVKVFCYEEVE